MRGVEVGRNGVGGVDDRVFYRDETLVGVDFSGRREDEWEFCNSRLENCKFEGLKVAHFCFGSGFDVTEYVDCSFDGSRIKAINPGNARFVRCSFRDVRLHKWICNTVEMLDCEFTGTLTEVSFDARIIHAEQAELGRSSNTFLRNDFSGAKLVWTGFRGGIDLAEQRLPEGAGYIYLANAEPVVREALSRVGAWVERDYRDEVLRYLEVALEEISGGQRQLLLSPYDWTSKSGLRERAFERLTATVKSILASEGR